MRKAVTLEEVKQAVEELEAIGLKSTNRAVRSKIGGGSATTVGEMLRELRGIHADHASLLTHDLSSEYLKALNAEIARHNVRYKAELQTLLETCQADIDQLTETLTAAEEKIGMLEAEATELRKTFDEREQRSAADSSDLRGRLKATIERLTATESDRDQAIRTQESAKVAAATTAAKLHSCETMLASAQAEMSRLAGELSAVREERAVLRQQVADLTDRVADCRTRELALGQEVNEAHNEVRELHRRLEEALAARAAAEQKTAVAEAKTNKKTKMVNGDAQHDKATNNGKVTQMVAAAQA